MRAIFAGKVRILSLLAAAACIAAAQNSQAAFIAVTGSDLNDFRSTANGTLTATSGWADSGGIKIAWNISQSGLTWSYSYTFTNAAGTSLILDPEISHWIFATSPTFTSSNIWDANFSVVGPQIYTATSDGNSNEGMPGTLFGIKANTGSTDTFNTYTFKSDKAPIWGSFFVRDGRPTYAYNLGFTSLVSYPDGPPATLVKANWIPTPDTLTITSHEVPEPTSLALLGSGLIGLVIARRRQREQAQQVA